MNIISIKSGVCVVFDVWLLLLTQSLFTVQNVTFAVGVPVSYRCGVGGASERGGRSAGVDLQQTEVSDGAHQPRGHLGWGSYTKETAETAAGAASEDSGRRRRAGLGRWVVWHAVCQPWSVLCCLVARFSKRGINNWWSPVGGVSW